jgi:mono/diheme cytochrome c family protein
MRTARALRILPVCLALVAAGCGGAGSGGRERRLRAEGLALFTSAGCASCHSLAAARAHGRIGPDFDTSERLDRAQIRDQLDYGGGGMPSYGRRLTTAQKDAVTEFLYVATHPRRQRHP